MKKERTKRHIKVRALLSERANPKGTPSLAGRPLFKNHPLRSAFVWEFRALRGAARGFSPLDSREPFEVEVSYQARLERIISSLAESEGDTELLRYQTNLNGFVR